ncbi:MAG: adenylate/guanylate cyclase domain-containing protein [Ignavibacteriaceae bacterium]|nr:adenylate/guanylate cyclase domain-containing protein [Ignavibacteriaceae bacterium]
MSYKIKIFIAEDENIIAKDISRTLERLGYEVLGTVRSGSEVIEKARELKPDLVLMDIVLEGEMSGIEAAEIIMTSLSIPVIYLTALADNETLQRAKVTEPFGYVIKPFDERALHSSIEMAIYKHKIDQQLKERTRELEEEKDKSNVLLHNIFPSEIVKELKETGSIKPKEFPMVTLLFTDFQGFTEIASDMHPQELVSELNDIFNNFDSIINKYGLEKLKTMGDSYMVAGGLPRETDDHASAVVFAALDMMDYLSERNKISQYNWQMRAGIHSGNVIAGVVGKKKYTYDVWGNTVNIASIMERNSSPGMVCITSATYDLINGCFDCSFRGSIDIMGNGKVDMYFVSRKELDALKAFDEKN